MDVQRKIASAMQSALELELALEEAHATAESLFRAACGEWLTARSGWKHSKLQEIATVERGRFSHRPRNLPEFFGGPYPFAQTGDVVASTGTLCGASQRLSDEGRKYSKSFPKDSILMTIAANIGFTAITTQETWCPDSVVGIVPHDGIDVRFLEYVLRTKQHDLESRVATQTAQKNINLQDLRPLELDIPDIATQEEIASQLQGIESAVTSLELRLAAARNLRLNLANESIGVLGVQ
jgi:type I restriction enzyme S subunit